MTTNLSPLGTLLLLRLSIAAEGTPVKPGVVRKDLAGILPDLVSEESLSAAREALVSAGLASVHTPAPKASKAKSPKPPAPPKLDAAVIELTPAGRAAALARLKVDGLPPKLTWTKLQSGYLLPAAMGVAPGAKAPSATKLLSDLAATEAGMKPGSKPKEILEALACRELGFPEARSWDDMRTQALNRMLTRVTGQPVNLAGKQLESQVPLALLRLRRPDDVKPRLVRQWLDQKGHDQKGASLIVEAKPSLSPPLSAALLSPAFASRVFAAADRVGPEGWFGDNKVFISHVWRRYNQDHAADTLSLADFKSRLVEAHRASHLTLSRADLVAAMNPADVAESEARYMNAQFHFILMEGASE